MNTFCLILKLLCRIVSWQLALKHYTRCFEALLFTDFLEAWQNGFPLFHSRVAFRQYILVMYKMV